ncbi:MAG: hypothetical protein WKG07_00965 [Hymenobacter sp.]
MPAATAGYLHQPAAARRARPAEYLPRRVLLLHATRPRNGIKLWKTRSHERS